MVGAVAVAIVIVVFLLAGVGFGVFWILASLTRTRRPGHSSTERHVDRCRLISASWPRLGMRRTASCPACAGLPFRGRLIALPRSARVPDDSAAIAALSKRRGSAMDAYRRRTGPAADRRCHSLHLGEPWDFLTILSS